MKILLVEDDAEIAGHVSHALTVAGHEVESAADGVAGLSRASSGEHAALILDRMLPGLDGLSLMKQIRANGVETPILLLTTMAGIDDRVEGLEAGADDYLVKPFAFAELLARVNAMARRAAAARLAVGDLEMDLIARTVHRAGQAVDLQAQEFLLLEYLMRNVGRVVTRAMLLEHVWKLNFDPRTNIVETHMSRLRAKLDPNRARDLIHTIRGTGYVLRADQIFHTEGFRITAIFVAIFAAAAAVLAVSLLVTIDQELRDQIVQFANADIAAVRDGYRTEGESEAREIIGQRMAAPGASDFFLLQRDGRRLAGNLPPMPPRTGILTLPGAGPQHPILGVADFLAPGLYVFSGSDLHTALLARAHIVQTLIWVLAGAMLMSLLGGLLVSRGFLSRTDAIAQTCRAIMDGDMKSRIAVRGTQDELDRLSQTINAMLDRIAALMENVRQVTNDIAHDLRTPVTHLRNRLEHARLHATAPADYDKALEAAIATSDDVLALFTALLRIAQIEGGARREGFAAIDLADLLRHVGDMFAPVTDDTRHILSLDISTHAVIRGDRELLVQLFSNLVENALVHTPPGTRINIALRTDGNFALAAVSDDGPGVPREEHEKLFRRFYRHEASRTRPGYGLGLALVQAIADLHGAALQTDRNTARGFAVRVSFPLS